MIDRTPLPPESRPALPGFTPVPRECQRHDGWTPDRQRRFIEALADTGSVKTAALSVNMSSVGAYYLRRQPGADSFAKAWEAAISLGVQRLEDIAMERAIDGVEVPVYSYGKLVGTRRVHNDRLLMFMLRNRSGDRFAADGAGRSASAKSHLARLKREWRAEWEAEMEDRYPTTPAKIAEVRASIERRVEGIRAKIERDQSPRTRRLFELANQSLALDRKRGFQAPEVLPAPGKAAEVEPAHREAEPAQDEQPPRVFTLRDGW